MAFSSQGWWLPNGNDYYLINYQVGSQEIIKKWHNVAILIKIP